MVLPFLRLIVSRTKNLVIGVVFASYFWPVFAKNTLFQACCYWCLTLTGKICTQTLGEKASRERPFAALRVTLLERCPGCHPERSACHPERSEGSGSPDAETLRGVYPERSAWAQGDRPFLHMSDLHLGTCRDPGIGDSIAETSWRISACSSCISTNSSGKRLWQRGGR
jgi:hypothetical protein